MPEEIAKAATDLLGRLERFDNGSICEPVDEPDGIRHEILATFFAEWGELPQESAKLAAYRLKNVMTELGWNETPDQEWRHGLLATFLDEVTGPESSRAD